VSRLWAESWRIGLGADRVEALRLRPFTRAQVAAQGSASVEGGAAPLADRVAAALGLALADAGAGAGRGSATVVLSNDLVHYAVLPWQAGITRPAEVQAVAQLQFERLLGDAAQSCTVQCHEGGWGRPVLACAVDQALVEAVRAALAERGLKLASMQPLLMAAANGLRGRLADDAALAIVERDRVCLARWLGGRPVEVASRHAGAGANTPPGTVVAQELALSEHGAPGQPVDVLLVGPQARWGAVDGLGARVLNPVPGPLALAGVA
jgi:hypothetical protein